MCALGRASKGSSIAVARTLAVSDSGQPPPKRFEPHARQNVLALPRGGRKVCRRSSPSRIRIAVDGTRAFTVAAPPESFLQLSQWQYRSVSGASVTSNLTPPQRQLPCNAATVRAYWRWGSRSASSGVYHRGMATNGKLTAKDYKTDQEVRWCPGCGDYAILAALQSFMPELDVPKERIVFISGIGCAARFPYYMEAYGMHSIHGRAPAIATRLATSRPDLSAWVVTGDGDSLSIGGTHLVHALRRNVNIKILLFNNEIYGLTKGQYSPTSPRGKVTKSTPMGSLDWPFNPISLAIGAEASFVARAIDTDRAQLTEVLRAAAAHKGSAFVEIFQNCNIFNDNAFDFVREDKENRIYLQHGEPVRFGPGGERGVRLRGDGSAEVFEGDGDALVWDAHHPEASPAFALSRLTRDTVGATPIGVFRDVERPVYDDLMDDQLRAASEQKEGELGALLAGGDTWTIS